MYLSEKGWVKVLIACAQGKKLHDKRNDLKEKDAKMELNRIRKVL
jgi:SsrA-binding protein